MTQTPDPFEHEDAAYLLGALSHEDRLAYEEHLQTCARCATAVAELAVLPGLLARLPEMPPTAAEREQPPDTVLPGLLSRMRRSRSRRRALAGAAATAAAAVLVGGTALALDQTRPTSAAAGVPVALVAVRDIPVEADLQLQDVRWGTRITMTCRYDGPEPTGAEEPHTYQLVVIAAGDGATQSVAQWRAFPGADATVAGSTDLAVSDIGEVQVRDGDGTVLLEGRP